jgi:hypothetical protein
MRLRRARYCVSKVGLYSPGTRGDERFSGEVTSLCPPGGEIKRCRGWFEGDEMRADKEILG